MYNFMKGLGQKHFNFCPDVVKVKDENQRKSINDFVFGTDEKTGFPRNDLGLLLNPATPEDVKRYIDSLIGQESVNTGESYDLTDEHADELLQAMPFRGESLNHYEERVKQMSLDAKNDLQMKKFEKYSNKVKENWKNIAKGLD